jgi:HSP20 family protein
MSTTDVFVVTDGLNSTYYTNTIAGTTLTTGLTLTNGTSGTLTTSGTGTYSTPTIFTAPTYNDFWNFDEQFDLLWKSFFDNNSTFKPIKEKAVSHPCDIQETDNGLKIEVAAVGLDSKDIDIIVDSETLRIAYRKSDDEKNKEKDEYRYLHRSIKKASFDIAWKISSKYDLAKLEAGLDKGLLTLDIPFAKENKPKKIEIKTAKSLIKG